jgi:hypothetical protein
VIGDEVDLRLRRDQKLLLVDALHQKHHGFSVLLQPQKRLAAHEQRRRAKPDPLLHLG